MSRHSVLLLSALLALPAFPVAAQQPAPNQLDRIEAKLDELLRRLPSHGPDPAPSAAIGQAAAGPAAPAVPTDYRPGALAVVRPSG